MSDTRLRVCTLNCWGLKYVAKNRDERIAAIASSLGKSDYDIIALQELWVAADWIFVRRSLAKRLPYAKYFYSGALGAGLALFSRYPIIGTTVHPYSLNGSPLDVLGGDWFVGKAAVSIIVAHPLLGELQVFNTHLFAKGGESGPEHHRAHRLVNAWEFSKLARTAGELGRYVIAMGDFNSVPTTLPMTIIRDHAQLTDGWLAAHPEVLSDSANTVSDAAAAVVRFGVTADSPTNTYSAGKPLDDYAKEFQGKRLDYVLFRSPASGTARIGTRPPILKCIQCEVVFTEHVPRRSFSYSDHFGLEATFTITRPGSHLPSPGPGPSAADSPFADGETTPANAPPNEMSLPFNASATPLPPTYLTHASVTTVVQALTTCYRISQERSQKHLALFGASLGTLAVLAIASAWLPRAYINPVFVLLTVALSWFATTMLYVGFVYGRWEVNALMNVIEELEIHGGTITQR